MTIPEDLKDEDTTIQLSKYNHARLDERKLLEEDYNDIVGDLLDRVEELEQQVEELEQRLEDDD